METETKALEGLAELLAPIMAKQKATRFGIKHDASGTPIAAGYAHGPGGALSFPGTDPDVFQTVVGNMGILGSLPTKASLFMNPTYTVVTGVQGDTGNEKEDVCDDAPVAGLKKICIITSVFGRYERSTKELELNRLGQRNDRADPIDLRLVGSPIHQSGVFAAGPQSPATPIDLLNNEIVQKLWERNISMHRLLSRQLWLGDPANNAGGGGYKELTGFDQLINTGYVDIETGSACPSIDSDLKDFNYGRIDIAGQGDALVDAISNMYRFVRSLALRTGVMPVRWVLVMRDAAFWELTKVWPCSYLTYRCEVQGNERVIVDGAEQVRMRDEMRAGNFLLIDGQRVDVILDDGINEDTPTTNANVTEGCFASDIYLVPMSVMGGQAVTFLEYLDYTNPSLTSALGMLANDVLVEGAFLTWSKRTNQCVQWQTKIEPRLVMRTPWLAGRLQNVQYCTPQHPRDPFPDDPYFVDGGRTSRPGPSYRALWQD